MVEGEEPLGSGDVSTAGVTMPETEIASDVTAREITAEVFSQEHASKDPEVIVTAGEAVASVPSQGHVVSLTVHDAHHDKEPSRMSLEEFLERFSEDEENEKVAIDFHSLSSDTVIFQRSKILVEGQPLLVAIMRKHPHFIAGCKLGASLRNFSLELLVAMLLDM
nr:hypothetical protein CFP56_15444 [Quercus suber]